MAAVARSKHNKGRHGGDVRLTREAAGWDCESFTTRERGERMVLRGLWRRQEDAGGRLTGYVVLASAPGIDVHMGGHAESPANLTVREMELAAGVYGRSRTLGMTEVQRERRMWAAQERTGRMPRAEDAVERALAKVAHYGGAYRT